MYFNYGMVTWSVLFRNLASKFCFEGRKRYKEHTSTSRLWMWMYSVIPGSIVATRPLTSPSRSAPWTTPSSLSGWILYEDLFIALLPSPRCTGLKSPVNSAYWSTWWQNVSMHRVVSHVVRNTSSFVIVLEREAVSPSCSLWQTEVWNLEMRNERTYD